MNPTIHEGVAAQALGARESSLTAAAEPAESKANNARCGVKSCGQKLGQAVKYNGYCQEAISTLRANMIVFHYQLQRLVSRGQAA